MHVAGEIAADLAEQGWVAVSGGAQASKTQSLSTAGFSPKPIAYG
jgi:hypothetical protein